MLFHNRTSTTLRTPPLGPSSTAEPHPATFASLPTLSSSAACSRQMVSILFGVSLTLDFSYFWSIHRIQATVVVMSLEKMRVAIMQLMFDLGHLYDCDVAMQSGSVEGLVPHDPPDSTDGMPRLVAPFEVVVAEADGDVIDIECAQTRILTLSFEHNQHALVSEISRNVLCLINE